MACLFCDIVAGAAPAAVVWRGGGVTAFLDVRPLFPGHLLVVPDRHIETLADAAPEVVPGLFAAVQQAARAVERGLGAGGSFVAINNRVSQSVPHLHVHVVPRKPGDGLRGFFWPRQKYESDAARESIRARLAEAFVTGAGSSSGG
jgi:histidine triad (HIT) family protein